VQQQQQHQSFSFFFEKQGGGDPLAYLHTAPSLITQIKSPVQQLWGPNLEPPPSEVGVILTGEPADTASDLYFQLFGLIR